MPQIFQTILLKFLIQNFFLLPDQLPYQGSSAQVEQIFTYSWEEKRFHIFSISIKWNTKIWSQIKLIAYDKNHYTMSGKS